MSFIQDFYESSVGRASAVIGGAFLVATNLTGCLASIPVERVVTQSVIRGTMPARQEAKREIAGAVRLTPCPTAATSDPAEPGLWGAFKNSIMPTVTVSVGDPSCGQNQQRIDQNGVAPRPRGQ